MERYSEYKDSGVQWLGEIPSHWDMHRWRFLLTENKEKNTGCKEKIQLQFRYGDIVQKSNQSEDADVLETISKYTVVAPDDIMINGLNLNYDFISQRVAQVRENGAITSAYVSLRPTNLANSKYYTYFLKSMDFKKMFHGMGTGIRLTLSYNELKNQFIPNPPQEEQDAMALYLDTTTAKIDEAIAQQQKMIDLLNERKQIIINNAVTKGLNPDVPMKDSGVDWIGEIPEGWEFCRLKHLSFIISKGTTPSTIGREILETGEIRFLKAENIVDNKVVQSPEFYIDEFTQNMMKRSNLQEGDLLFVIAGATIGKVAILPKNLTPANTNQAISFIRLIDKDNIEFVWYVLQSNLTKKYIWENAVQSAQPNISMEDLGNIRIPMPNKSEQMQIIQYIEKSIDPIEKAIVSSEQQISLLQERKQIIINEVVTGKVKVL